MLDYLSQPQALLLLLLAVSSGMYLMWPALSGKNLGVSASEAVRLINREKAVLIDVSEPAEFAAGHAAGARNVPVAQLEASNKALPSNKKLPVVLVCPTGSRASRAVLTLKKLGYEQVVSLSGGLTAWRDASLPTEKTA